MTVLVAVGLIVWLQVEVNTVEVAYCWGLHTDLVGIHRTSIRVIELLSWSLSSYHDHWTSVFRNGARVITLRGAFFLKSQSRRDNWKEVDKAANIVGAGHSSDSKNLDFEDCAGEWGKITSHSLRFDGSPSTWSSFQNVEKHFEDIRRHSKTFKHIPRHSFRQFPLTLVSLEQHRFGSLWSTFNKTLFT